MDTQIGIRLIIQVIRLLQCGPLFGELILSFTLLCAG